MAKTTNDRKKIVSSRPLLSLLVMGQGKGRLSVESLFGPRVHDDLNFFYQLTFNPKEADVLVVTGPVGPRLEVLIGSTYEQMHSPKKLLVAGTEALNGGVFDELTMGKRRDIWEQLTPDAIVYGEPPTVSELCEALIEISKGFSPEKSVKESGES